MNLLKATLSTTAVLALTACGSSHTASKPTPHAHTTQTDKNKQAKEEEHKVSTTPGVKVGKIGIHKQVTGFIGIFTQPGSVTITTNTDTSNMTVVPPGGITSNAKLPNPNNVPVGNLEDDLDKLEAEEQKKLVERNKDKKKSSGRVYDKTLHSYLIDNKNLDALVLEGVTIPLQPAAKGRKVEIGKAGSATYGQIGKDLKHAVYGWFGNHPKIPDGFSFTQGKPTDFDKIPKQGTAEYRGNALYRSNLLGAQSAKQGDVKLNVDFGNKKLSGNIISADKTHNFYIEADIYRNAFRGSTKNTDTHGYFYGPNAEELAGEFSEDSDLSNPYSGAFGATRQNK